MAMYHIKAQELKPFVIDAHFNAQQLNLIHKMMRSCSQLRQGSHITSFFECMLPEGFKIQEGQEIEGKYGMYKPLEIVEVKN